MVELHAPALQPLKVRRDHRVVVGGERRVEIVGDEEDDVGPPARVAAAQRAGGEEKAEEKRCGRARHVGEREGKKREKEREEEKKRRLTESCFDLSLSDSLFFVFLLNAFIAQCFV